MFSSISLPNIFISLLLCSAAVEGHSRYADRFEHARRHAPKDFRRNMQLHNRQILQGTASAASGSGAAQSTFVSYNNYTSGRWRAPAVTSAAAVVVVAGTTVTILQPKIVTVTVPIYQICEITGSACSTAFQTATTTICSTVLTGFFTRATVTDCNQSITFSTKTSFSLTSTVVPAVMTPIAKRQAASTSTFAQTIVSYYVAPWQSIAANNPTGITVNVCRTSASGVQTCSQVQEVWEVVTQYVPTVTTSPLSMSQYFPNAVVLLLPNGQSIVISPGNFNLATIITIPGQSAMEVTSTSQLPASTTLASTSPEITTTITSRSIVTVTITVKRSSSSRTSTSSTSTR